MDKKECLETALQYVTGERQQTYGSAKQNFGRIANLWSCYLRQSVTPWDVANMMILMKMSRLDKTPDHKDSWIDIAGYAACGAEITSKDVEDLR